MLLNWTFLQGTHSTWLFYTEVNKTEKSVSPSQPCVPVRVATDHFRGHRQVYWAALLCYRLFEVYVCSPKFLPFQPKSCFKMFLSLFICLLFVNNVSHFVLFRVSLTILILTSYLLKFHGLPSLLESLLPLFILRIISIKKCHILQLN